MDPNEIRQIGPYKVVRYFAEGGMAWIFEVEDPHFEERRLALKMLKPHAAVGQEFTRFESEAALLAKVDHPNLVTVFAAGFDEETGCHYYTMSLIDGPTLAERGQLDFDEAAPIFCGMLQGLEKLHSLGILHRDIKPSNIFINADGRALLGDLGIASHADTANLTATNMVIGTATYMTPEQARGKRATASSDIFSVGLTLYRVLHGTTAYEHIPEVDTTSSASVLFYLASLIHSGQQIDFRFDDEIPEAVRQIILKACAFKVEDRFQSAAEMREAIEAAAAPAQSLQASQWLSPPVAAAVASAIAIGGLGIWYATHRAEVRGAADRLAAVQDLERRARAVYASVDALEPAVSKALLADVAEQVEAGQRLLAASRDRLDQGETTGARAAAEQAAAAYTEACLRVGNSEVQRRSEQRSGRALDSTLELADVGAADFSPDRWKVLMKLRAEIQAPIPDPTSCEGAAMLLARIDTGERMDTLAAQIRGDLSRVWPEVAGRAREEAVKVWNSAAALGVDHALFAGSLERGRRLIDAGDDLRESEQYLEAREFFVEAREAFDETLLLGQALQARAATGSARQRADAVGLARTAEIESRVAAAQQAFAAERWGEALREYERARLLLEQAIRIEAESSLALAAASEAEQARQRASQAGAKLADPDSYARADALLVAATEQIERQEFEGVVLQLQKATELFDALAAFASQQLGEIQKSRQAALRAKEEALGSWTCNDFLPDARAHCLEAEAAFRAGEAAVDARDAGRAQEEFEIASRLYRRARLTEQDLQSQIEHPPSLVSRTPAKLEVAAFRNQKLEFRVEARDPNPEDVLSYVWMVDGEPVAKGSPAFSHRPTEDAVVTVTVDDGRGMSFEETWRVAIKNGPPVLAIHPDQDTVRLKLGDSRTFNLTASDPDGDALTTSIHLDGRLVGDGRSYVFLAEQVGRYTLEARATDAPGATRRLTRIIQVEDDTVAAVRPKVPADVAAKDLMKRYEVAYEDRSLDGLREVWIMNPKQRTAMTRLFGQVHSLDVDIQIQRF